MKFSSKKRKLFLSSIKTGDIYAAKIEELIESGEAIINFKGNLIKVKNNSDINQGEYVTVKVVKIKPNLIFEIVNNKNTLDFRKSTFDVCA